MDYLLLQRKLVSGVSISTCLFKMLLLFVEEDPSPCINASSNSGFLY